MARINIEENWWTDPRREKLAKLLGDELLADGAVIRLWRIAQEYWKNAEPIPNHLFEHVRFGSEIVKCGLAKSNEEGVYVRGSTKSFEWLQKRRDAASKAGKKSAESRRKTKGTSQPTSNQTRTKSNQTEPNTTIPNQTQPSYSPSSSSSISSSFSFSGVTEDAPDDAAPNHTEFNRTVWEEYRRLIKGKFNNSDPVRNAKVNNQIAQLTKRIPHEEVFPLLDFYFKSENGFYVKNMFDIGLLLQDAEKLLLQMRSGVKVVDTRMNGLHPKSPQAIGDANRQLAAKYLTGATDDTTKS